MKSVISSSQPTRGLPTAGGAKNHKDEEPQYHVEPPHCVRGSGGQSVPGAAAPNAAAVGLAHVGRQLEYVAGHGCQHVAGST
jgi:hypothetical protein